MGLNLFVFLAEVPEICAWSTHGTSDVCTILLKLYLLYEIDEEQEA